MRSRLAHAALATVIIGLLAVAITSVLTRTPAPPDRAFQLESRLRCPVCTSVSVAESGSPTAVAMRQVVAEQIAAGRSDQQILDYFQARYGQWVLLNPPIGGNTTLLWLLPGAGALVGIIVLAAARRRPRPDVPVPSAEQLQLVERAVERLRHDPPEVDQL